MDKQSNYTVFIKESAKKELEKIPEPYFSKIETTILNLEENPLPQGSKKLKGTSSSYRVRVSNYRIVYTIDNAVLLVEIIKVGHRKAVYKKK